MNGDQAVRTYIRQQTALGNFAPTTARQTGYLLRSWLLFIGATDWRETTLDQAIEWITVPNSKDGKHRRASCIRAFYRFAYVHDWTATDRGKRIPNIRASAKNPKPAPDHIVLAAIADARHDIGDAIRLGRYAGMRCDEIAQCHSGDLQGGMLLVHGKGSKDRWVPAHPEVTRVLSNTDGWIFPSSASASGHWTAGYVSVALRRALPDHWTAHTLRHAFATDFYHACLDLVLTAEVLGHASTKTTERYVRVRDERATDVVRGMRLKSA